MGLCHVLPGHSRRLVRNLKGGMNSDWQGYSPLTPTAKIAISLESKNYTTFCPHAFRAKGDSMCSLSIRRFWGKRGMMEAKKGERWRRETPDTDAFTGAFHPHTAWFDTIQSKSLPVIGLSASRVKKLAYNKSHLTVWPSSGACVATISLFSETSNEELSNTCNGKPAVFEEL